MSKLNPMNWSQKARAYCYRVCSSMSLALIGVGGLSEGTVSRVMLVVSAILGVGMGGLAAKNTSTTA